MRIAGRIVGWPGPLGSWLVWTFLSGFVALLPFCWLPRDSEDATSASDLPRLAGDLASLHEWFARADGMPRVVALLSPTCSSCLAGAVALQQGLLRDAGDDVRVAVVWMDMLPSDDEAAARRAKALLDDPRVTHFRDRERHAGRAWAGVLGVERVAWDAYLLFDAQATWSGPAPRPRDWFHQLGSAQADPARRRTDHALAQALHGAGWAAGWLRTPEAPDDAEWDVALEAAQSRLAAAEGNGDGLCAQCRAARRLGSYSPAGWRRLVLRHEGHGHVSVSGARSADDANSRLEICLYVTGLRCPQCLLQAGEGVLSVRGVEEVEMRPEDGQACALIGRSATVSQEDLLAAVRAQGFGAEAMLTRRDGPCPGGLSAEACLP